MFCIIKLLITIVVVFVSIDGQDGGCSGSQTYCDSQSDCAFYHTGCHNLTSVSCNSMGGTSAAICQKKSGCYFINNACNDIPENPTCDIFNNVESACLDNGFLKCAFYTV
jgi:hypothetical protein